MTIVSRVTLKRGTEAEWDAAIRERFEAAHSQGGWLGGQLTMPIDRLDQRVIIGSWETRAHWEAWHNDPAFTETKDRLEGIQDGPAEIEWHEVVLSASPT